MEQQFLDAWACVTKELRANCGSMGTRLHYGSDGLYYGYAQWPDRKARENATLSNAEIDEARKRMREAIEETLPDIDVDPQADFLSPSPEKDPSRKLQDKT